MRDTLEDLYFGKITPNEQDITPGSVLADAMDQAEQCEEKLANRLEGEEKTLLLRLLNAENEISSTMALENFVLGFRLGMRMTIEALDEDDGNLTIPTMAKKRANGEGNIRKRKDGRWEGRYTAGYDSKTGKRIIKNVLGKTQAEVKEKLKKALEECQGLDVSRSEEYTVATWLRTWYELYAKPNVRATANRYELIIETYTIPRIGSIKPTKSYWSAAEYMSERIKTED